MDKQEVENTIQSVERRRQLRVTLEEVVLLMLLWLEERGA